MAIDCICKYPACISQQATDCLLPAVAMILQDKNSIEKSQFAEETLLKCEEQFQKQMYVLFYYVRQ